MTGNFSTAATLEGNARSNAAATISTSPHAASNLPLQSKKVPDSDTRAAADSINFRTRLGQTRSASSGPMITRSYLTTVEFASRMLVLPQTVLKAYSRDGAYCGIRPVRLPNRRLAWPEDNVEMLFAVNDISTVEA